ncbi:MAG: hypothetical protein AVDCRST_MAG68-2735, partial [uncultured Gemmatimonadetes bacterium]
EGTREQLRARRLRAEPGGVRPGDRPGGAGGGGRADHLQRPDRGAVRADRRRAGRSGEV